MKAKPFTLEVTPRAVRFTFFGPVPGAVYLQPLETFTIPRTTWDAILAAPPATGEVSFFNFTPDQLAAHGVIRETVARMTTDH